MDTINAASMPAFDAVSSLVKELYYWGRPSIGRLNSQLFQKMTFQLQLHTLPLYSISFSDFGKESIPSCIPVEGGRHGSGYGGVASHMTLGQLMYA